MRASRLVSIAKEAPLHGLASTSEPVQVSTSLAAEIFPPSCAHDIPSIL